MTRLMKMLKTRSAKLALIGAAIAGTAAMIPARASADDHVRFGIGFSDAHPVYRDVTERVWVEPVYRTVEDRVWVAPVTQDVCDHVWVEPAYEMREVVHGSGWRQYVTRERVLVTAGHYEDRHHDVVVAPGHWETAERQEVVTPGHWEYQVDRVHVADRPAWNFSFGFFGR